MVGTGLHALRGAGHRLLLLGKRRAGCSFMMAFRKEDHNGQRVADPLGSFFKIPPQRWAALGRAAPGRAISSGA